MSLFNAAIAGICTVILGVVSLLSLAASYDFLNRTRTGFVDPTPAGEVDDGLVKIRGTVAADASLDPAVADTGTVMSKITLSRQAGLSGRALGSWTEAKELLCAVPFEVEDETGAVPVEHEIDTHRSGYEGLTRTAAVELDGSAEIPESVDAAFAGPEAGVDAVVESLEDGDDEEPAERAEELRRTRTDGGTAADVLGGASPLRAGVPQKFEEEFAAPGDEVYVVGTASEGRISNESGAFQVLHEPRSKFELTKGLAGGLALAGVGIATGYGAVNWLLATGRELLAVVAFIA